MWDWSSKEADEDCKAIHWAAFYSDCEHEVLEVQKGHRITLTYNLYIHERIGAVLSRNPTADPQSYPLFLQAAEMLANPKFLREGMILEGLNVTLWLTYSRWQPGFLLHPCIRAYHQDLFVSSSICP